MIKPALVPLHADRWTPFAYVIRVDGVDLTGADLHAQVRLGPDSSGLMLDLPLVTSALSQGVRLLRVDTSGPLPSSYIRLQVPGGALGAAMPAGAEQGDIVQLAWDLLVTMPGRTRARWLYGPFSILPGSTQLGGAALAADPPPGSADAIATIDREGLTVTISGADPLAPMFDGAQAARDEAAGHAADASASADASALAAAAAAAIGRRATSYADGVARFGAQDFSILAGDGIGLYNQASGNAPIATLPSYLALAAADGPNKLGFGILKLYDGLPKTLSYFGCPVSSADVHTELQTALSNAAEAGLPVLAGSGAGTTYKHDGPLDLTGVQFDGQGAIFSRMHPETSPIRVSGTGGRLYNLGIAVPDAMMGTPGSYGRSRGGDSSSNYGLYLDGAIDFKADRIAVNGCSEAAICAYNSHGLRFGALDLRNTEADALNLTGGTSDVVVQQLTAINNGDDQLAINGYADQGYVSDIEIVVARLIAGRARSAALLGCRRVTVHSMLADSPYASALYIGSELNPDSPAQSTHGALDVWIGRLVAITPVTTLSGYAAISLFGRDGGDMIGGEYVQNQATAITIADAVVRGGGAQMRAALSTSVGTDKMRIGLRAENLRGNAPLLAELGGGSLDLTVAGEAIGGGGVIWTGSETGRQHIRGGRIGDLCKDSLGAFPAYFGWNSQSAAATYDIDGAELFSSSTQGVRLTQGAPDAGRLRFRRVTLDGVAQPAIDYTEMALTPAAGWTANAAAAIVFPEGIIHLTGILAGAGSGLVATVPVGARPPMTIACLVWDSKANLPLAAAVFPDGKVQLLGAAAGEGVYLDGITYRVGAGQ